MFLNLYDLLGLKVKTQGELGKYTKLNCATGTNIPRFFVVATLARIKVDLMKEFQEMDEE